MANPKKLNNDKYKKYKLRFFIQELENQPPQLALELYIKNKRYTKALFLNDKAEWCISDIFQCINNTIENNNK